MRAVLAVLALCAAQALAVIPPGASPDIVDIPGQGKVMGVRDMNNNTRYWLHVPVAAPPTGALRFLPPQPRAPWDFVLDATEWGDGCISDHHNPDVPKNTSEDCLGVNIYAPSNTAGPLPVLIWFYGGSFQEGSDIGPFRLYDAAYTVSTHNIVVVGVNYRLGALGFLRVKDTGAGGNAGVLDQDWAMRWVQKYISLFGGDPTQVTIQGESAGAMSVGIHLTRPGTKGLFNRAIMESNPSGFVYKTAAGAEEYGASFCKDVPGCWTNGACNFSCLQSASVDSIVSAWEKSSDNVIDYIIANWGHLLDGALEYTPTVDGVVITEEPLRAVMSDSPNWHSDAAVLLGTNTNEGSTFIFGISNDPLPSWVADLALPVVFGFNNTARIVERPRYNPANYNDSRDVLSYVLTDYWFRCASEVFATGTAQHSAKAFVYRFNHRFSASFIYPKFGLPEVCVTRICHATELPFVWHNDVPPLNATFTPAEEVLATQMNAYWASFVKHGDPNVEAAPGSPIWPTWDPATRQNIVLNTEMTFENTTELCGFWDSFPGSYFF